MRRLSLTIILLLFWPVMAGAEIVDVRDMSVGEGAQIFVQFETRPELLSSTLENGNIVLNLDAHSGAGRVIETPGSRALARLEVLSSATGQLLVLHPREAIREYSVSRTYSGFLISWQEAGMALPNEVDMSSSSAAEHSSEMEPSELSHEALENSDEDMSEADVPNEASADSEPMSAASTEAEQCHAASLSVEADPWDIDALTVHAGCLLDDGDADRAVVLLERVVAFEPGRFDAVIALAEAQEARGEIDAARALYQQAASIAATDGQAVAARARANRLDH